jgi:hypothetical protein
MPLIFKQFNLIKLRRALIVASRRQFARALRETGFNQLLIMQPLGSSLAGWLNPAPLPALR